MPFQRNGKESGSRKTRKPEDLPADTYEAFEIKAKTGDGKSLNQKWFGDFFIRLKQETGVGNGQINARNDPCNKTLG